MLIDPRRCAILLAVHREGGIIAAADVLKISPSAVSQQINKLEAEVGIDLVERTTSGTLLTPAGRLVAATAEKIESDIADLAQQLRPLAGQVTGTVNVGGFQSVLRCVFIPILPSLEQHLPGIELQLTEIDEINGSAMLRSGSLDFLVIERDTRHSPTPRGYEDIPLLDEPWMVVSPENAPAVSGIHDLARLRWLQVHRSVVGGEPLHRIRSEVGSVEFTDYTYSTYDTALSLLRAGLGSTVLPSMAISGIDLTGLRVTALPDLGARRILLRKKKDNADNAVTQVISHLLDWAPSNAAQWSGV